MAKNPHAQFIPHISVWNEYKREWLVAEDRLFSLDVLPEEVLSDVQRRTQPKFNRMNKRWDVVKKQRVKEWNENDTW
ncbi:MAG: hypothetical protein GKR87_06515 [Kiritimatiellae bacterium]|nr:hypothetical protein [Kiritimatiellia bacterium]